MADDLIEARMQTVKPQLGEEKMGASKYKEIPEDWPPLKVAQHYKLPFLSWLPKPLADFYVRWTRRGTSYQHVKFVYSSAAIVNSKFKRYQPLRGALSHPT